MIWSQGAGSLVLLALVVTAVLVALLLVVVRSTTGARRPATAQRPAAYPPRPTLGVVDEVDEGQFVHETDWRPGS